MPEAKKKKYKIDRLYVSNRGLHLCFATQKEAAIAYIDGTERGHDWLVLDGTQLIDTRLQKRETPEVGEVT